MHSPFSERSSKAYHNGKLFEQQIQELLPEFQPTPEEPTDGILFDAPAEIKCCECWTTANWQRGNTKLISGRYFLRDAQHSKLLRENGRYIFGVLENGVLKKTRIVLASRISAEFEGAKTLSWPRIFRGAV